MKEFIILMAFLMALIALSIDAMLPALGLMTQELGVQNPNHIQYVISCIFIGMGLGTLFYGPLSDSFGRKPMLYTGLALFICGSALAWQAETLTALLIGRLLQGMGAGAPRVITTAIVRDRFEGREMASIMSLIMGFFILFPAFAPAIGQGIMALSDWRGIFIFYIIIGIIALLWSSLRLDETHPRENRRPLNAARLYQGLKETLKTRVTIGYTICSGFVFGALITYISSAQQIFHEIFGVGTLFPLYFGILALGIGAAFFSNSYIVKRLGMRRITEWALISVIAASALLLVLTLSFGQILFIFMVCSFVIFFGFGLTFGNMNAMALEPMGHIAGLASAIVGAFSTAISVSIGILLGQLYNGTLIPLSAGFMLLGIAALATMAWTEKGLFHNQPNA